MPFHVVEALPRSDFIKPGDSVLGVSGGDESGPPICGFDQVDMVNEIAEKAARKVKEKKYYIRPELVPLASKLIARFKDREQRALVTGELAETVEERRGEGLTPTVLDMGRLESNSETSQEAATTWGSSARQSCW